MVENSPSLGLGASYSQSRYVIKDLSKLIIYQHHLNGVFTPRSLNKKVFTILPKTTRPPDPTMHLLTIMRLARLLGSSSRQIFQVMIWESIASMKRMAMILSQYHCLTALFYKLIIVRNLFILKFSLFKELLMDWQRILSNPLLKSIDGWREQ